MALPHVRRNKLNFDDLSLVGREEETSLLRAAVDRALDNENKAGPQVVLVYGESGVGKSALWTDILLADVAPEDTSPKFFVGTGKYEQFKAASSLSAFADALKEVCTMLSVNIDCTELRANLKKALNLETLQGLISTFPSIRLIMDDPDDAEFNGSLLQGPVSGIIFDGLKYAVRVLLGLICNEKPVAVAIDDLQWADAQMLDLIKSIAVDQNIHQLMVVLSYRENEIDAAHPVAIQLSDMDAHAPAENISRCKVDNLSRHSVYNLVAEVLDGEETTALADVVFQKTRGNPFYVLQLLRKLERKKLISFDAIRWKWSWKLKEIETEVEISENVVTLVIEMIVALPDDTREVLQIASCLGSRFDCRFVDEMRNRKGTLIRDINAIMDEAKTESLFFKIRKPNRYRFTHDKIRQAAYSMFDSDFDRQSMHLNIGRTLKKTCRVGGPKASLLTATEQLNLGASLIEYGEERIEVAILNQRAAVLATEISAFRVASIFLKKAIELVPSVSVWTEHYALSLELHVMLCNLLYTLGEFIEGHQAVVAILQNARVVADTYRARTIQVAMLGDQEKPLEALKAAFTLLRLLGSKIPRRPSLIVIFYEYRKTQRQLKGRSVDSIVNQAELLDKKKILMLEVLIKINTFAWYAGEAKLRALLCVKAFQLMLKYGMWKFSSVSAAAYGSMLAALGNFDEAYKIGCEVGKGLSDRFGDKEGEAKFLSVSHGWCHHLRHPLQDSLKPLLYAYTLGMQSGDVQYAGFAIITYCVIFFYTGLPLTALNRDLQSFEKQMDMYRQVVPRLALAMYRQCVRNLLGFDQYTLTLTGEATEEDNLCALFSSDSGVGLQASVVTVQFHYLKMLLAYIFGKHELAFEMALKIMDRPLKDDGAHVYYPQILFFSALTALSMESRSPRRKFRRMRSANTKELEKWLSNGCMHIHHKVLILRAEIACTEGNKSRDEIKAMYDVAIATSSRIGHVCDTAIVLERAGIFLESRGEPEGASYYLSQSYAKYGEWEAEAKRTQMRGTYSTSRLCCTNLTKCRGTFIIGREVFEEASSSRHMRSINDAEDELA